MEGFIAPKGWTAPKPEPSPVDLTSKLTGPALKEAVALALVDVLKGDVLPTKAAARAVAGIVGAPLTPEAWEALVGEIGKEWAQGEGIDVPAYVPPKPPEPVVIEEPKPGPKEVP